MSSRESKRRYDLSIKGRYRQLKAAARARKIPLALSLEEYSYIVQKEKCFYCSDTLPARNSGLDRIDNAKGYEPGNVVPCCYKCNSIKGTALTHTEMIGVALYLKQLRAGYDKKD